MQAGTTPMMGTPSMQPPPQSFQPTAVPPAPVSTQHTAAVASPPQQPFVPTMATPPPATRPQVYNPIMPSPGFLECQRGWHSDKFCASGGAAPASPKRPSSPPTEPLPPHDINALNADTSKVPAQFVPIVAHLKALFTKFESANVASTQKRIVADASKRVGMLFWDLNRGKIAPAVAEKVMQYAQALSSGDTTTATRVLADLTETAWDETSSHWLSSFKRLIRLAQTIK